MSWLADLRRYEWTFDIVGDGESRAVLERKTSELGLTGRVQFFGFQTDPGKWYRQADLFLFPSSLESFGLTVLEAMSYGVPCLAMRADGKRFHNANAEIIRHGADGFLAESDEDFGRQLEQMLKEPKVLRAVGESAREAVERRHTWDKHIDRYEHLFGELLGQW